MNTSIRNAPQSWIYVPITCLMLSGCLDPQSGGDESCPAGTVRSGQMCLSTAGTDEGGSSTEPDGGEEGGTSGGESNAGDDPGGSSGGSEPDPQLTFPITLDDHFFPSGFMGDGEVEGISADLSCPERAEDATGECHHFVYTPAELGWAGVWWQGPEGNWGEDIGVALPTGLTTLTFTAWGGRGGELIEFGSGYGSTDGFAVSMEPFMLTDQPTRYSIDLAGIPVETIAGGFYWVAEAGDAPIEFYIDDIEMISDEERSIDPCTVTCATAQGVSDCEAPSYQECRADCEQPRASECVDLALAYRECVIDDGWSCLDERVSLTIECVEAFDALIECEGALIGVPLPFEVTDHFFMSEFMGGGDVEVSPCETDDTAGDCQKIIWTPGDSEWVGFFYQYPENNWGEQPGVHIASGATHVRYRVWGETGEERANFAVGIEDADGFNIESGYSELMIDSQAGHLLIPEGITEVTGAFAWFLENPLGRETVTFYLDDIEWRDDAPPESTEGIIGCTDPSAENYDVTAESDDGSCLYEVSFNVEMTCEAPIAFDVVFITGPFCNWCDEGFPLSDDDGDGVWSGTYEFPAGALEYKYMVDGFADQEDLVADVQIGDGACAPVTDGSTYANRQLIVDADITRHELYGRCSACQESGLEVEGVLTEEQGWRLTWSDEFNAAENSPIDSLKWVHEVGGGGWGNGQLEHNTDRVDNAAQDGDGYLIITAKRENYEGNAYTSARIKSQGLFSQQYGRFEARMKLPYGQGIWPAFWMLGDDISDVGWPNCGEIDIMEYRGQTVSESTGALHGPGYSGGQSLYSVRQSPVALSSTFHTYAVEWDATGVRWYVDDDLFMEKGPADIPQGTNWTFDHHFFLILNVAIGGGFVGAPDEGTTFPQRMYIDYVRVYEAVSDD